MMSILKTTNSRFLVKQASVRKALSPDREVLEEIKEMLVEGHRPRVVAHTLEVSLDWVYDVLEDMEELSKHYLY